jgi:hypothetical protein
MFERDLSGIPFIRISPPQAMRGVSAERELKSIFMAAGMECARQLLQLRLSRGRITVEAVSKDSLLTLHENINRW